MEYLIEKPALDSKRPAVNRIVFLGGVAAQYTNMPAALGEWLTLSNYRQIADLRGFTEFRMQLMVLVVGNSTAVIGAQYSIDAGVTWNGIDNGTAATQSTVTATLATPVGPRFSVWGTINNAAKIDSVWIRPTCSGGDAAADPSVSHMQIEFR